MAAQGAVFALSLLLLILIIILAGFTCYICRNYCLKNFRLAKTDQRASPTISDTGENSVKTVNNQSRKTLNLDHILKDQSLQIIKPA